MPCDHPPSIMPESVEYRTLLRLTATIQRALRDSLVTFGAELVSLELIPPDLYDNIRNSRNSPDERAADLVGHVREKVKDSPQHYHTFVQALNSDQSQYRDQSPEETKGNL